ncbi:hypothetical protein GCM10010260_31770 [Streptomyces filipinensis]|uniref:Uncharacterized protein n=1 Tax=Streptomyces filipinensis TaxID=66887 RepID=A0A918IAP6_9ACTN|nr:DUF6082 family protein [Streptomyces filipinensis]GGU94377.1 hypothetical protein GCM10010260_31770 [Streptomyces filipinensis]
MKLWRNRHFPWGIAVATIATIALTPLVLKGLSFLGEDWQSLSNVGQAYGFLSVIFSGAALIGVAVSLAYQAHQTDISNEEERRAAHRELALMSINDPELLVCWAPSQSPLPLTLARQLHFTHLIVTQYYSDYLLKRVNDDATRVQLELHFRGERARDHWVDRSAGWREFAEATGDARQIRFVDLMDEAYENAAAAGPSIAASSYFAPDPGS